MYTIGEKKATREAYGAALAAKHLAERGCKQVLCYQSTYQLRQESFCSAAQELGMQYADFNWDTLSAMVEKHIPVGIFTTRDADGLNLLAELRIRNFRIGKDVLLVSFDDHNQCVSAIPSLSSVHQPTRQEGQRAVEKLVNMIFGKVEEDETVNPRLMVRESSGGSRPSPGIPESETVIY